MRVLRSISDFETTSRTLLTLGVFDGIHRGHLLILNKLNELYKAEQCERVMLIFRPHPRQFFAQNPNDIKLLYTLEENIQRIRKSKLIDTLVVHTFDNDLSETSAEEFIQNILIERFKVSHVVIGSNHRFGKGRRGTFEMLSGWGDKCGFGTHQVEIKPNDGVVVSSTTIRNLIEKREIVTANKMLGHSFFYSGEVIKGRQIGKTIGYPTINLTPPPSKITPPYGVYLCRVRICSSGEYYNAISNIGVKPTFSQESVTIEAHLFGFDRDIYSERVQVEIVDFIRPETKFESVDELQSQIKEDIDKAKEIFSRSEQ